MQRPASDASGPSAVSPPVPRAALLAAWGTAALQGRASPDEAAAAVVGDDAAHRVRGLPADPGDIGLTLALGRLRAAGVRGLRLVLPVPGDAGGLPGPASFNAEAVQAGEVVVTVDGPALGMLPRVWRAGPSSAPPQVRWDVQTVDRPSACVGVATGESLAEVERLLAECVRTAAEALDEMDVARARPGLRDRLADAEAAAARCLPPGYPARAHRVLAMACRLHVVAALGLADSGAAVSARAAGRRAEHLATVATRTRHALVAAVNAWSEPSR